MDAQELIQGSEAWKEARAGSLGASALHEAVAKTKTGWGASRANRMAALIVERLTGQPQETFVNAAMAHGTVTEPEAREFYEFVTGNTVEQIGLVKHPTIAGTHASPDGLVNEDGLLEIKCPQPANHLATLLGDPIPHKYMLQMQWQARCCDRAWIDFVSYSPAFPANMRLHVQRVGRDNELIASIEKDVREFLAELDAKVESLTALYERRAAA